ncbi:MAG: hypothetical protein CVU43_16220 [Chloroflexi bacterium HGW-Chloroflexi-5]|jgi:hypothetical protein|nr:MAG: hypothetical protein CVU43_16220 [Chloroflexi bacterium HGW-Chloroflexi-5]
MKAIRLNGLRLTLDETQECLAAKAAGALGVRETDIISLAVIRKALDARRSRPPYFVYAVKICLADSAVMPEKLSEGLQILPCHDEPDIEPASTGSSDVLRRPGVENLPVVVAGSGPAGLFAAYALAARSIHVLLLERGRPIEKRVEDVKKFWEGGILHPQSNVLFGEGGAGTFSDGKLTSRTKNPYAGLVKKVMVEAGAPPAILTDAKPHIGTDKLRQVIVRMRKKLAAMGCVLQFEAQVTDFVIRQNEIAAVVVNGEREIKTNHVILAIGQSADDTYEKLYERGVKMEPKPFAMGLRVEHPQALINSIQYGKWSGHSKLPPAEYFVTAAVDELNRSVYTFCMCPGGQVIGCSAFPGTVITNGMSNRERSGEFANSAVVVNVRVEDFAGSGEPLNGLSFRSRWEREAFRAGGSNYCAPAQKITDFLKNQSSGTLGRTSFLPGVKAAELAEVLPVFVADALRKGIRQFDKKMPGFISEEAHLIGVETRTSSPLRICRGSDGQSESVRGLYPCGEGAGYAGGIISSALDGMKVAQSVIRALCGSP